MANNSNSVLIVEDDHFQAQLLKMMLTNLNFTVLAVTKTGEEAVDLASKLNPGIIFMDIALAGNMDGIESVKRITENSIIAKIIYVTSNSDSTHKKRAEAIGFDDFLVKPISKKTLVESLERVIPSDGT
jgi:two-component system, response regulator PdtaR